ncbi:hypothetical protein B0H14DRAFT_3136647 [Mycena olivaceomarginata]|nr:hypothetical protein B0H14DRAFT_3136647 [Mycena olivaceomarginata]
MREFDQESLPRSWEVVVLKPTRRYVRPMSRQKPRIRAMYHPITHGTVCQQPGVPRKTPSSARPTIREPQGGAPPERTSTKGNKNDIQHEWKMPKPFQQEELRWSFLRAQS